MTAPNPTSKAGQLRAAEKTLRGLLRTPKTRNGLVAAVCNGIVGRNFVYGWLAERRRDGTVTTLKSGKNVAFQIAKHVVIEVPAESVYPAWLDPRIVPMAASRAIHIDGKIVEQKETK